MLPAAVLSTKVSKPIQATPLAAAPGTGGAVKGNRARAANAAHGLIVGQGAVGDGQRADARVKTTSLSIAPLARGNIDSRTVCVANATRSADAASGPVVGHVAFGNGQRAAGGVKATPLGAAPGAAYVTGAAGEGVPGDHRTVDVRGAIDKQAAPYGIAPAIADGEGVGGDHRAAHGHGAVDVQATARARFAA
jgi:hypothetical protein